jgi:hypothetical protein
VLVCTESHEYMIQQFHIKWSWEMGKFCDGSIRFYWCIVFFVHWKKWICLDFQQGRWNNQCPLMENWSFSTTQK